MDAPIISREPRRARYDPSFAARIVGRRALLYAKGADPALDRPEHVRAASGLAWFGDRLLVIQDDANFVALVDPATGLAEAVSLPPGPDGQRLFGDDRGSKHLKLDLEACIAVPRASALELIAFGSGTKPLRERIVSVAFPRGKSPARVRVLDASSLYRTLHEAHAFSGSELNLEGAALHGDTLLLVQRGNGAPRDGRRAVNAIATVPFAAFDAYLGSHCDPARTPSLTRITTYELGEIQGVPFTFTDVTLRPSGALLFLASAEASSDAVSDGSVHGTRIGLIDGDNVRTGPLLDEQGAPSRIKAEGIAVDPHEPTRAFLVIDMDDHSVASELLEVRLTE